MTSPRDPWRPGRAATDALALSAGVVAGAWVAPLLPGPAVQPAIAAVGAAGLVWAGLSLRRRRVPLREIGLRWDDLRSSGGVYLACAGVLIVLLSVGGFLDPASPGRLVDLRAFAAYFPWALFQQFLAVSLVWCHLSRWLGSHQPQAVLSVFNIKLSALTASVFALVHAPNPGLMALVWVGEATWILLFARFRNLYMLAAAHTLSALAVAQALQPSWLLPSTRVGLRYVLQ